MSIAKMTGTWLYRWWWWRWQKSEISYSLFIISVQVLLRLLGTSRHRFCVHIRVCMWSCAVWNDVFLICLLRAFIALLLTGGPGSNPHPVMQIDPDNQSEHPTLVMEELWVWFMDSLFVIEICETNILVKIHLFILLYFVYVCVSIYLSILVMMYVTVVFIIYYYFFQRQVNFHTMHLHLLT